MINNIPAYSSHNPNLEGINVKKSSLEGGKAYAVVTLVLTILAVASIIAGCYRSPYYFLGCAVIPALMIVMIAKKLFAPSNIPSNALANSSTCTSTSAPCNLIDSTASSFASASNTLPPSTTSSENISTTNNATTSEASSSMLPVISSNAHSVSTTVTPKEIPLWGEYIGDRKKIFENGGDKLNSNGIEVSEPGRLTVFVDMGDRSNGKYFKNVSPNCKLRDFLKHSVDHLNLSSYEWLNPDEVVINPPLNDAITIADLQDNNFKKRLHIQIKAS